MGPAPSRIALAAALAVTSASCVLVVPRTKETTVRRTEERHAVTVASEALEIAAEVRGEAVAVTATRRRTCDLSRREVREVRRRKRLGVWWADPCGGAGGCSTATAIAIVLAPATLLVSALVSVPIVATSRARTARETFPMPPERVACDLPAEGVRLRVSAPGHPDAPAVTDGDGRAHVPLGDPAAAAAATVHVDDPAGVAPVRVGAP